MQTSELPLPFKRNILREDVKNYILNLIMTGEYQQGERIIETKIARHLNISQAPVREAIRDLEQIGVLETEPYKGTYVREFSEEDLRDSYQVREELEALAIRSAIRNIQKEELEALEKILGDMTQALMKKEMNTIVKLDVAFHEIIIRASKNKVLERVWQTVNITYWTFRGFAGYRHDTERLIERHKPILTALYSGNVHEATAVIRTHFSELRELLENIPPKSLAANSSQRTKATRNAIMDTKKQKTRT